MKKPANEIKIATLKSGKKKNKTNRLGTALLTLQEATFRSLSELKNDIVVR